MYYVRILSAVYVHAVYVYETLNPGSIIQIWAGNCNGRWKCLWNGKPNKVGHQPRQFGPPIEPPSFLVSQLRIHFDGSDLPYHAAIDAVCLLGKCSVNQICFRYTQCENMIIFRHLLRENNSVSFTFLKALKFELICFLEF